MNKLELKQMEVIEGGVSCSQASGWLFGAGLAFLLIPGLAPLGITLLASSSLGATCND
jgi:hypothetical protein